MVESQLFLFSIYSKPMSSESSILASRDEHAPTLASALIETFKEGYSLNLLYKDIFAGITVGIIAIPLSMALAIATGVPPQHGLYTAIIAGLVIALTGGSRVNISGPTAAFVVILLPIVQQFGLGGLAIASVMAGFMLFTMGLARMGKLIEYIPYPVVTGFTAGIGVVIATIQIKDFFGLQIDKLNGHYLENLYTLLTAMPTLRPSDLFIGCITMATLILWHRLRTSIPSYLMGLIVGSLTAVLCSLIFSDFHVTTIGSRFNYSIGDITGHGIPPLPPLFVFPWTLPNADGQAMTLSWGLIKELIGPAFAIAMLGAIESLLCAVVADGLAGTRHNPNSELMSQGLGNMITPFFAGIPATAAIARTAANIRSGGRSPISAIVHSFVVLIAVLALAGLMAYVPMSSLAALLFMVAWNMSELPNVVKTLKTAPRDDKTVLLVCFTLTVLFDMVISVGIGLALAALLFIRRMADLTEAEMVSHHEHEVLKQLPEHIAVYEINGPLFFGAAEKAIKIFHQVNRKVRVIIIDMTDVPMMDMTGIIALQGLMKNLTRDKVTVILSTLSPRLIKQLNTAGVTENELVLFCKTLEESIERGKAVQVVV